MWLCVQTNNNATYWQHHRNNNDEANSQYDSWHRSDVHDDGAVNNAANGQHHADNYNGGHSDWYTTFNNARFNNDACDMHRAYDLHVL